MKSDLSLVDRSSRFRTAVYPGPVILCVIVLLSGLVEIPRHVRIGEMSGLAILTLIYLITVWLLWLSPGPAISSESKKHLINGAAFLIWAAITTAWSQPSLFGIQNLVVSLCFLGCLGLGAREARANIGAAEAVMRSLVIATVVSAVLYLLSGSFQLLNAPRAPSPRTFSLFALLGLAGCLAFWRMGNRRALWLALSIIAVIVTSLSRMGTAAAFAIFLLAQFRPSRIGSWLKLSAMASAIALASMWVVDNYMPARERVLGGYTAIEIGSLPINTSGRINTWTWTFNSFKSSPFFGQGAGSAAEVVASRSSLEHPHSDYLRILHDFGLVGFVVWVRFWFGLVGTRWRSWRKGELSQVDAAPVHLAAALALIATMFVMLTDNPMSYVFVLAPLGCIVGASLGLDLPPGSVRAQSNVSSLVKGKALLSE